MFTIYLPAVGEGVASSRRLNSFPANTEGSETVLLVDDNDFVRGFIRHVLVSTGYSVQEARDGCEALKIDEHFKEPIHLLLNWRPPAK